MLNAVPVNDSPVPFVYVVSASALHSHASVVSFHFATCPSLHPCGRLNFGSSEIVTSPLSPPFGSVRPPVTEIFVMSPPESRASVCPLEHGDLGWSPSFTF